MTPPTHPSTYPSIHLSIRPNPLLQQTGNGKRLGQLLQIKAELRFPYRDRRAPFRGVNEDQLFELLSGETDATLRPGMKVTGRVQVRSYARTLLRTSWLVGWMV